MDMIVAEKASFEAQAAKGSASGEGLRRRTMYFDRAPCLFVRFLTRHGDSVAIAAVVLEEAHFQPCLEMGLPHL